jgi:hypothetical protein
MSTTMKAQALSDFVGEWMRLRHLPKKESWNIGPSTSMGPYNFKVLEQEF